MWTLTDSLTATALSTALLAAPWLLVLIGLSQ
jgi:hypothetical protein